MAAQLFANNATSALAAGITSVATSLTLATGQGALFPAISGADFFLLTLTQPTGPEATWEIVKVTARTTDTLTIVRAQEGTTAAAWATGAKAELRVTAAVLNPAVSGGANGLLLGSDKAKLDATSNTNTGDETLATIKTKLGVSTLSGSNTGDQVLPTTLPASDVYAWAKTATKPSYTATEVGLGNVPNLAFSGTNTGDQTLPTLASLGAYAATNPSGYITGSGSTTGSSGSVTGLSLNSSASAAVPDNVTQNQIGYNGSVSLFGQTDGGLYSSAHSSPWVHQIYGDFRTGQVAIRGKNSGTWQAWRTVLDSSNYTSYSPSLTGGGASGSWGISVTGNAGSATTLSVGADRTKLDGIAASANNYSHPANHAPSIITQDASNRFVTDAEKSTWNDKAPLASPTFTGVPAAPTPAVGDASTKIATTAFVATALGDVASALDLINGV